MDHLIKVIEREKELQRLAVDGENILSYFNENPDKKQMHIEKCYRFRDEVANDDMLDVYKDPLLGAINKYINKLEPRPSNYPENKDSDSLLYFILGAIVGVIGVYGFDKLMKKFEEKIADGIIKGIYKGMGE